MRYVDQYARECAKKLQLEFERVAKIDEETAVCYTHYKENLRKIEVGEIAPPSDILGQGYEFLPDQKYSESAMNLYYAKKQETLLDAAYALLSTLQCSDDVASAKHCKLVGLTFPDGWPLIGGPDESTVDVEPPSRFKIGFINCWGDEQLHEFQRIRRPS